MSERTDKTDVEAAAPAVDSKLPKRTIVVRLLKRNRGATVSEMSAATGWKVHSVRAHLTGLRKKGLRLIKERRRSGETSYGLCKAPQAASRVDG